MDIPKIIHHTWIDENIPAEMVDYVQGWKRFHPDWTFKLWTNQMQRAFVCENYPEALLLFDSYLHDIQRVDMARYLILLKMGGVSVDLDMECLQNIEGLLEGQQTVLCREHGADAKRLKKSYIVSTAFMASVPDAPIYKEAASSLQRWSGEFDHCCKVLQVIQASGPIFFTEAYKRLASRDSIKLLGSAAFYPLALRDDRLFIDRERLIANGSYGIHHFASTWW